MRNPNTLLCAMIGMCIAIGLLWFAVAVVTANWNWVQSLWAYDTPYGDDEFARLLVLYWSFIVGFGGFRIGGRLGGRAR